MAKVAKPAARKFTFDVYFDELEDPTPQPTLADLLVTEKANTSGKEPVQEEPVPEEPPEPEAPPQVIYSEEDYNQAKEEAYVAGHAAALQETAESMDRLIAVALEACAESLKTLFVKAETLSDESTSLVAQVTQEICKKLLPHTADEYVTTEITSMVQSLLPELLGQSRVIVKTNPHTAEKLEGHLKAVADKIGFEGRLVVIDDSSILPTDVFVEWSDGGAERNTKQLWSEIDALIERNIPLFQRCDALDSGTFSLQAKQGGEGHGDHSVEDIWPDIDIRAWYTPPGAEPETENMPTPTSDVKTSSSPETNPSGDHEHDTPDATA